MANRGDLLRSARVARGLTQVELARRSGISRQALGAIEAGVYQPGVIVALALARELGEPVEGLFVDPEGGQSRTVGVEWAEAEPRRSQSVGAHVTLARVGGKLVAVAQPAVRLALAPAAGMIARAERRHAEVTTYRSPAEIDSVLLIAGCDPAAAMLGDWLARQRSPVSAAALACSSTRALAALKEGRAHAAGMHLKDRASGEYNVASVRDAVGRRGALVVRFARWELGLATAPNRLEIRGVADLCRRGLRIVNRERGSGARLALDEIIEAVGLSGAQLEGYNFEVGGHLEVAAAIAAGQADAGVTLRLAAEAYGLGFIALREERYDLAIMEKELTSAPVRAMLDAINSRRFAREVSQLCAYDTGEMGRVVVPVNP